MLDLGSIRPRRPLPAGLDPTPAQALELRQLAKQHMVSRAVAVRLAEAPGGRSEALLGLIAGLDDDALPSAEMERELPATVARMDAAARGCRVGAFPIKGLAARRWYRRPSLRHLGDLDLWVKTRADAERLAEELAGAGSISHAHVDRGLVQIPSPAERGFDVDVHFGLGPHFQRQDLDLPSPPPGLNPPPAEVSLLSVLAGVPPAEGALLKDANDVYAIAGGAKAVAAMRRAAGGNRGLRRAADSVTELFRAGFAMGVPVG